MGDAGVDLGSPRRFGHEVDRLETLSGVGHPLVQLTSADQDGKSTRRNRHAGRLRAAEAVTTIR